MLISYHLHNKRTPPVSAPGSTIWRVVDGWPVGLLAVRQASISSTAQICCYRWWHLPARYTERCISVVFSATGCTLPDWDTSSSAHLLPKQSRPLWSCVAHCSRISSVCLRCQVILPYHHLSVKITRLKMPARTDIHRDIARTHTTVC